MSRRIAFIVLIWALSSCAKKGLIYSEDFPTDVYGSDIILVTEDRKQYNGELIAVDDRVWILQDDGRTQSCDTNSVMLYELRLAQRKGKLGWAATANLLLPISHGILGLITLPVSLITLGSLELATKKYDIKHYEITYQELRKFGRFPQGIPSEVNVHQLTPRNPKYDE